MIIQILNLSSAKVFSKCSQEYKIYRDVYSFGLLGLEIRGITSRMAKQIQQVVLQANEICYKKDNKKANDLFITGSLNLFKELSRKIVAMGDEELGYKVVNVIKNFEEYGHNGYSFLNRVFNFQEPYIMGILNVTPDSFSDGGKYINVDLAVEHAIEMLNDGADIIDIGGESTRPGSDPVSIEEEIRRTLPVIKAVRKLNPECIISIDTYKSEVAKIALENGASIVNDISGLTFDKNIVSAVKMYDAGLVIMHMKGIPKNMQDSPVYSDVIGEIYDFLYEQTNFAVKKGIRKIFIDPGIGFGKRIEDNFEIINRLGDFKSLGYPILIGLSRKSFIGNILELSIDQRDIPSAILDSISVFNSARIIRTHNVKLAAQSKKLLQKLL